MTAFRIANSPSPSKVNDDVETLLAFCEQMALLTHARDEILDDVMRSTEVISGPCPARRIRFLFYSLLLHTACEATVFARWLALYALDRLKRVMSPTVD